MLNKAASSFSGGRYRMLEPDDGKLSSPVLRGLALSNGGRPLGSIIISPSTATKNRTVVVGGCSLFVCVWPKHQPQSRLP